MTIYAIAHTGAYGEPTLALYDNLDAATQHLNALNAEMPQMRGVYQIQTREVRSTYTPDT